MLFPGTGRRGAQLDQSLCCGTCPLNCLKVGSTAHSLTPQVLIYQQPWQPDHRIAPEAWCTRRSTTTDFRRNSRVVID